jgi:ribosomal protein S18 acetylase RimI-like enzyme
MIRLHPIKNQASPYWDSLVRIYRESFPIDEQRPIESIARLLTEEPRYTMHAIIDDNYAAELQAVGQAPTANSQRPIANSPKLLGLLTTWHFEEFIYIEHFAIDPTLRSQGYGSEALKAFIHEHGKPIVLEAEPPTDALSIRRIKFYERCGFTLHDYPYMQPAYTKESHPVELRLMGTLATEATPLTRVTQILHHEVYKCDLTPRP